MSHDFPDWYLFCYESSNSSTDFDDSKGSLSEWGRSKAPQSLEIKGLASLQICWQSADLTLSVKSILKVICDVWMG